MLLGSKDEIDLFQGNWDDYASKGAIIPLNDLLDKYGQDIKKAWPQEAWDYMKDKDGKIWGIPRGVPAVHYPIWVRSDWMKKLNLKMPQTIDELEAVLKAFKEQDPDGNGKADTIPMMTDLNGIKMAFLGGFVENGNSNWVDPADKKLKPVELAPGFKDFVAKMADWYQKGYIYKESFAKFDPMELAQDEPGRHLIHVVFPHHAAFPANQAEPSTGRRLRDHPQYPRSEGQADDGDRRQYERYGHHEKSEASGRRDEIHQLPVSGFADEYADGRLRQQLEIRERQQVRDRVR
ncbi:extracellular solute-binding protein [Paenibacillus sp. P26]|nr:extracellular solute-binding protein [Paenibacillus sp. P26]